MASSEREVLVQRYKRLFNTQDGKHILEDLQKRYGYGETLYIEGMSEKDLFFAAGKQEPVNYIMRALTQKEGKK